MGELDLIRWIRTRGLPGARRGLVKVGPGDDCAVLAGQGTGWDLLLKTDGVVAGVHFGRNASAGLVGRKALARALSDIAATGGEPVAAVVHAALARRHAGRWARELQKGLARAAGLWRCPVVGGDVSATPGPTTLAVALLGRVERGRALLRSRARPGDRIFVTGELGGSILGRHLRFDPRLAEGRWLARRPGVGGAIDVSDGLTRDLGHILEESGGLGAELSAGMIPVARAARRMKGDPLGHALADGEDYELLFTVRPGRAGALVRSWPFRTRLTEIGVVRGHGSGLWLRENSGRRRRIRPAGWEHLITA
ncbi:MAG TPA: thiamine-phosphate kinase [Planctomycetota bacterium]|nr:thiamine-phosphate kinase [Planctomycetota bacterium]